MTISAGQRFTRQHPCPVCGGHEALPRGHQERCWGFLSDDGKWAHCTRDDLAGGLPQNSASDTYAHRLDGDCACGVRHDARPASAASPNGAQPLGEPIDISDFTDEHGRLLYQEVRYLPKTFRVRRPDGNGWKNNLGSVRRVLFNLPALTEADPAETVWVVEGSKDAKRLISEGLLATTNALGAKRWEKEYSETLAGRQVVIVRDNDDDGREHVQVVARSLFGKAQTIRVLALPGLPDKGDVSDWLDAGHSVEELQELAAQTPLWRFVEDAPGPEPIRFEAQTAGDFLAEDIPAVDAILSDGGNGALLSPGEKMMIAGPPGVGKTNVAINMAAGLAAGTGVLGLPCGRRWNVLNVALEGNRKRLQKRVRKVLTDADAETKSRFHFARLSVLDLSDDAHVQALEDLCRRNSIDVLIIDPFRDAHPWGEDKSEDAARVMRVLDRLLAALPNLAIVLIHHVRKPDTGRRSRTEQTLDEIRGSGHLVAACQSVLLVNEDPNEPDKLLADWVKHRDAEERIAPMFLYFDRATLSYEVADRPNAIKVPSEMVVTALTELGGHSLGQALLTERLMALAGCADKTAQDAIRDAVSRKLINEEKAPADSPKKKAYRLPSELPDTSCDHWPPQEIRELWAEAEKAGADTTVCTCCGAPFPPPLADGACDVCKDGAPYKTNTGLRLAVRRGAKKLEGGFAT